MKRILVKPLKHGANCKSVSDLALLLDIELSNFVKVSQSAESMYRQVQLLKKSGLEFRTINAPCPELKTIQRSILDKILVGIRLPSYVYGFGAGRTIVDNANRHRSNPYLLNVDIKNFFDTVHYKKVQRLFIDIGYTEELSLTLTKLTTLHKNLPQGAPTSPYLASLVLNNLDNRLMTLCKKNRLIYTRYFDDISISGGEKAHSILDTVIKIVGSEGYEIHTSGEKIQLYTPDDGKTKIVTGIHIDTEHKLVAPDSDFVESYLSALKNIGLTALQSENPEKEKESLRGKIAFISQVDSILGKRLMELFLTLTW